MNVYYDPRHPAGFGGKSGLTKLFGKKADEWLRDQETYTLHAPVRKRFTRNFYRVSGIDDTWQADLCDMRHLSKYNDGYNYILTVIDLFSKHAWAVALKNKSAETLAATFDDLFATRKPRYLMTDKGLEFNNAACKRVYNKHDVHYYTSQDPVIKCGVVERFNRTLKERMYRYFTYKNTQRYIDVLQDLVYSYNHRVHSSTKVAPADVNEANSLQIFRNLYGHKNLSLQKPALKVGDHVRITREKAAFEKSYKAGWSREIFVIDHVLRLPRAVYKLKDLAGEEIKGTFYQIELQKVNLPKEYKIEQVLRKRNKGKELYVKWVGYPDKFNSWIQASDLV